MRSASVRYSYVGRHRASSRGRAQYLALPVAAALAVPLAPAVLAPAASAQEAATANTDAATATGSLGSSTPTGSLTSIFGTGSGTTVADPNANPAPTPTKVTYPTSDGLPEGVKIEKVEWISDRWVNVYIYSPSNGKTMEVAILLARDWYTQPDKKFPAIWALDGLRTGEVESGWTSLTNIEQFYADKNVNVVMPISGNSSFYTDWQEADQGVHYMWETFLTQELPAVLNKDWRMNGNNAVVGLSMGATGAMNLAERHPDMFKFVGSFSGYLDTSSYAMPDAIGYAVKDGGNFDGTKMWGPYGTQGWKDHDPKLGVANLKNMTVYVSAGNGLQGAYDEPSLIPGISTNYFGLGLEIMSRMTSETFVEYAKRAGVPVITKFRPNGTHSWKYWEYEMTQAWPYMADALGVPEEDRVATCAVDPVFEDTYQTYPLAGACVAPAVDEKDGGKSQQFRNSVGYWSAATNVAYTWGRTGAKYQEMGGPDSWLGFPIANGGWAKDYGQWAEFQHGYIYWSTANGYATVNKKYMDLYRQLGYEYGFMGFPIGDEQKIETDSGTGYLQKFEGGVMTQSPNGDIHYVRGDMNGVYMAAGGPSSWYGWPITDQNPTGRGEGQYSEFEHGILYWTPEHKAISMDKREGQDQIWQKYKSMDYERSALGHPITEAKDVPGGKMQEFENGAIFYNPVTPKPHSWQPNYNGGYDAAAVIGDIYKKYVELGGPEGALGLPYTDQWGIAYGGAISEFMGGKIYWHQNVGAHAVPNGIFYDTYAHEGFEGGRLGFPTSDVTDIEGGQEQTYERGKIQVIGGVATVIPNA